MSLLSSLRQALRTLYFGRVAFFLHAVDELTVSEKVLNIVVALGGINPVSIAGTTIQSVISTLTVPFPLSMRDLTQSQCTLIGIVSCGCNPSRRYAEGPGRASVYLQHFPVLAL